MVSAIIAKSATFCACFEHSNFLCDTPKISRIFWNRFLEIQFQFHTISEMFCTMIKLSPPICTIWCRIADVHFYTVQTRNRILQPRMNFHRFFFIFFRLLALASQIGQSKDYCQLVLLVYFTMISNCQNWF